MSPECECRHLLPSPRLPASLPIHAVILLCQSPPLLAVLPYKTNLLVKPPHVSLNMAHLSTLTCKVPSSVSPSFLSCPYSYHLGCSSSVLRSLDCLPQSPLEDAVLPFDRFQSKFVQVSHITLSLDSFSPSFTSYLTDLIQAVNCLCGCLVTASLSENRRRQVYTEDLCADPAICFNQSRAELFRFPSPPVHSCFCSENWHCHQALNLHIIHVVYLTGSSGHSYFNAYHSLRFPLPYHTTILPGTFSIADTFFFAHVKLVSSCLCWVLCPRWSFP